MTDQYPPAGARKEPLTGAEILDAGRAVVLRDSEALLEAERHLDGDFIAAIEILLTCPGKVIVTGMGTSGATARRIAHLLSCGGTPSLFAHAADGLHGGLGAIAPGDVVIAISKGGETSELNEYCLRAKTRGARCIALTAETSSELASIADVTVRIVTPPESDPAGMMAMGSALAACAVGDAFAVVLMQLRSYQWERFEYTHPGGAVGKAIREQT